jgi:acyl-coenzyme A thioesterase PaaI-like protein
MEQKIESLIPTDYNFGHGKTNPHGLRLNFSITEQGATTQTNIDSKFQGWPGIVHGGITATMLDEAMGCSVYGKLQSFSVSAQLQVTYLAPVMTGEDLLVAGKVVAIDGRKISASAEVRRIKDNSLLAEGNGLFITVKGSEQRPREANDVLI